MLIVLYFSHENNSILHLSVQRVVVMLLEASEGRGVGHEGGRGCVEVLKGGVLDVIMTKVRPVCLLVGALLTLLCRSMLPTPPTRWPLRCQ